MRDDRGSALRVARATTVAATSLAVTAAAHTWAHGTLPDLLGLTALGAVALLAGVAVAGRRLRAVTLVPVLAALQVVLHLGFTFLSTAGTPAATGHAGHDAATTALLTPSGATTGHGAHLSTPMLLAHAVAVVVLAAGMLGADAAADVTARHLGWVALLLVREPTTVPGRPGTPVESPRGPLPRSRRALRTTPHRGPPAGLLAGC